MNNAAVGTSVGEAGTRGRVLALSATVLVVVLITLTAVLFTASPPAAPASSGGVGEHPSVMGGGGEHYGEGWNNYGR